MKADPPAIRPLAGPDEAAWCAALMASSEPWLTLGRSYDASLRMVRDPTREVYVAMDGPDLLGFLILAMGGPLPGYIQTVCVSPSMRGRGLGTRLIGWAEARILRDSPWSGFTPATRDL
ncbi:MAG: GNAT family N-acetyltransferase [Gemmatimonadales bacterium]